MSSTVRTGQSGLASRPNWRPHWTVRCCDSKSSPPSRSRRQCVLSPEQPDATGKPSSVPAMGSPPAAPEPTPSDRPHRIDAWKVHAAFGLALRAWNQGWSIGVFQFVKSAKWKVGEEAAFRALGAMHEQTGEGGAVSWHKMGEGWSWIQRPGNVEDHAASAARDGHRSSEISRRRHMTSMCWTSSRTR